MLIICPFTRDLLHCVLANDEDVDDDDDDDDDTDANERKAFWM